MPRTPFHPTRRQWLTGALASACALPAWANTGKPGRGPVVAQLVDTSPQQQDVSRDFLIGARAAWQDLNSRGGLRGTPVQHLPIEVDGSPASVRSALARITEQGNCIALSGSVGHGVASQVTELLRSDRLELAHAAPWLSLPTDGRDDRTFPIFANHQTQIAHVLKSHANLGLRQLGVVYANALEEALHQEDIQRSCVQLGISLQSYRPERDLRSLGQRMGPSTPAMLLFVGGTPELAQFTQGLDRQARQRYVLGLADINLQTLAQMGTRFQTPIIAAQAVPMVTAGLPVVRQYRQVLGRLFDEAPSPLSLSGYIAARYTQEVLADVSGSLTRASVLDAFQRRSVVDVGGFSIAAGRNAARYVTQSMLSSEGQVIG